MCLHNMHTCTLHGASAVRLMQAAVLPYTPRLGGPAARIRRPAALQGLPHSAHTCCTIIFVVGAIGLPCLSSVPWKPPEKEGHPVRQQQQPPGEGELSVCEATEAAGRGCCLP